MRLQILVVEDHAGDVILMRAALNEAGIPCELHVIRDGIEALKFLNRTGEFRDATKPDLIVLDWILPYREGPEVLAQIKKSDTCKTVPIIVHSAFSDPAEINRAMELGADIWLPKTNDLETHLRQFAHVVSVCTAKLISDPVNEIESSAA